jgi:hypothetical protein
VITRVTFRGARVVKRGRGYYTIHIAGHAECWAACLDQAFEVVNMLLGGTSGTYDDD